MAGSFQRIKEKMQRFFFGNEEPAGQEGKGMEIREADRPPQLHKQSGSYVKMRHFYPKSVSERAVRERKQNETPSAAPPKEKKQQESTAAPVNQNPEEVKTSEKQNEQLAYFQGNDFSPEDIPSPIFGFERVPLHSSYLKKHDDSDREFLPMENETADETASSEDETLEEPSAFETREEADDAADTDEGEEIGTEEGVSEAAQSADVRSDPDRKTLTRQERRRRNRERQEAAQTGTEEADKGPKVPFNVLRHAGNRQASAPSKKPASPQQSSGYHFPSIQLLKQPQRKTGEEEEDLSHQKNRLEETLQNFNVDAEVVDMTKGPSVTRYEVQPAAGVKVNKVTNLTDDLKLAMAAKDLRMEAPIPGKGTIGIEVPNAESEPVLLREILRRDVFIRKNSPLTVAMGMDISGAPIVTDLQDMPHGLIAGATGSGKSVCINSILLSLLYKADPDEVKLMLIDPKMVELASYKDIPHLVTPVINDAKEATAGLKRAVAEMNERYEKLAAEGVRDIKKYNEKMESKADKMPYMVIVIDELADLMMVSPQDVEDAICRIAQKARACGIHLLVATQRPSVDVITGLIKANIPSRTAFAVSSQADSRTILDSGGAERLIGKGDMLFHQNGTSKPLRVQGTFVTDEEIDAVTDYAKKQKEPAYMFQREDLLKKAEQEENSDELFPEACRFVCEQGGASSSLLQRHFSIGYNRAARLIDMMENQGIISEANGSKPRRVLLSGHEVEQQISG
ncbi:DNA translocase FtsK [Salibacterium sp. K-3]